MEILQEKKIGFFFDAGGIPKPIAASSTLPAFSPFGLWSELLDGRWMVGPAQVSHFGSSHLAEPHIVSRASRDFLKRNSTLGFEWYLFR